MITKLTSPIDLSAAEFRASWPTGTEFVYEGPAPKDEDIGKPLVTIKGNIKKRVRRDGRIPFFSVQSGKGMGGVVLDRLDFVDVDGVQVEEAMGVGIEIQSMRQGTVGKLTNLLGRRIGSEPSILIHSDNADKGDSTNNCIFNSIEAGQCDHDLMAAIRGGGNKTGAGAARDIRVNFLWLQAPWVPDEREFEWKPRRWLELDWCLEVRILGSCIVMDPFDVAKYRNTNHVAVTMARSKNCSIFGTLRQRGARNPTPPISIEHPETCSAIFNFNVNDAV